MPVGSVKCEDCAVQSKPCVYGFLTDAHSGNEPAKAKSSDGLPAYQLFPHSNQSL